MYLVSKRVFKFMSVYNSYLSFFSENGIILDKNQINNLKSLKEASSFSITDFNNIIIESYYDEIFEEST